MEINLIRTEADYEAALRQIDSLMNAAEGSEEGDYLDLLATLVSRYEERRHPIKPFDDPIDFLAAYLEATNRTQADLAQLLGSRSRASEIMSRKRRLTTDMIYRISTEWGVAADLLVKPYEIAA